MSKNEKRAGSGTGRTAHTSAYRGGSISGSLVAHTPRSMALAAEAEIEDEIARGGPHRFVPKKKTAPKHLLQFVSEDGQLLTDRWRGVRIEEVGDTLDGRRFLRWMLGKEDGKLVPAMMQRKIRMVLAVKGRDDRRD